MNDNNITFLDTKEVAKSLGCSLPTVRQLKKHDIIDDSIDGKVGLHSLRHTYATRCIEAGIPPKVLQKLLGHTDVSVTLNTYCNAFDSFSDENIALANDYMKNNNLTIM